MERKTDIHAVDLVRQVRDQQAKLLQGKSTEEIIEFFCKAGDVVRKPGRAKSRGVANKAPQWTSGAVRDQERKNPQITEQRFWKYGVSTVASSDPRIQEARVTRDQIIARLVDGRVISVPLAWFWRLSEATPAQRANFRIIGTGQGVHWPDVDEDISVEGMLHGTPAPRPKSRTQPVVRDASVGTGVPNRGMKPPARKVRRS